MIYPPKTCSGVKTGFNPSGLLWSRDVLSLDGQYQSVRLGDPRKEDFDYFLVRQSRALPDNHSQRPDTRLMISSG